MIIFQEEKEIKQKKKESVPQNSSAKVLMVGEKCYANNTTGPGIGMLMLKLKLAQAGQTTRSFHGFLQTSYFLTAGQVDRAGYFTITPAP